MPKNCSMTHFNSSAFTLVVLDDRPNFGFCLFVCLHFTYGSFTLVLQYLGALVSTLLIYDTVSMGEISEGLVNLEERKRVMIKWGRLTKWNSRTFKGNLIFKVHKSFTWKCKENMTVVSQLHVTVPFGKNNKSVCSSGPVLVCFQMGRQCYCCF